MAIRRQWLFVLAAIAALGIALPRAGNAQSPSSPPMQGGAAAQERDALFAALLAAKTDAEAREIEERLWNFWFRAPDAKAQQLMDKTKEALLQFNYNGALAILDELIKHAPAYAEGWKQRATILFLTGAYEQSLAAIEETLKREPKHYGALAGRGIILMFQGKTAEAQIALKQALAINPWLKERALIAPPPPGQKI